MRARFLLVFLSSALGAFAACSSEHLAPPGQANGTYTPGGATGVNNPNNAEGGVDSSLDGAGTCNTVALKGVLVDATNVTGDPPAQTGGAIADGDYDITDVKYYTGSGGATGLAGITWQGSATINKGRFDRNIVTKDSNTNVTTPFVDTFNLFVGADGGTVVQIGETCPVPASVGTESYTASPTQLVLVDAFLKTAVTYTHR
jgi:hypothetical protein